MKTRINRAISLLLIIPVLTVFSGLFSSALADEPDPAEPAAAVEAVPGDEADPIIDMLAQPEEIPAAVGTIDAAEEDQEEPEIEYVDQKAGGSDDILEEGSEDGEDKEDEAKEDEEDGEMTLFAEDGVVPYDPSQIVLPFTKVWNDNDDELGLRPDSIEVKLYRYKGDSYTESDLYDTATVTAAAGWKYEFVLNDNVEDQPAFYIEDGEYHAYNFAVAEEPINNYTEDESAHKDPEVTMEVIHGDDAWIWVRPNSVLRYEVETDAYPKNFLAAKKGNQLYIWTPEELSPLEQMIVLAEVHEHNQFPHETWENTDFLTGFGHHSAGFTMIAGDPGAIVFDDHPAWSFWARGTYTRSTVDEHAGSITNKAETAKVTVTKVWEDEEDIEGFRPDSVEVKLYIGETAAEFVDPIILDEGCEWTGSWDGLPLIVEGKPVVYTVKETETDVITGTDGDGTYAYEVTEGEVENSFTITNTHTPVPVKVDVTKVWEDEDDKDGFRPDSVTINLLADGVDAGEDPLVLDEDCEWSGSWEGLPKYADGAAIVYSVEEETDDVITGEDTETTYAFEIEDEQDEDGNFIFTVTNTHTPVPVMITVTKVWEDEDDKDGIRPGSVEVKLYVGETLVEDVDPLTLDESGKWTGAWENLPKYADGKAIEYTVKETETNVITGTDGEGTYAYKIAAGEEENSFTITNTHTPKEPETITINVTKVWDDADNKDKLRPETITVRLLADGKEVSSVKITAKDSWKASFKDLPAEKDGKKIEYTVSEDKVSEYTAAISGSADKGFTIKNSHTPKKDPEKPDDPKPGPKTGDRSDLFLLILVLAESFVLFVLAIFGRRYLIRRR